MRILQGEELAKRTFNPKLGIQGGLSVIGTTGIVEPMSNGALVDTIRLELHMRAEEDQRAALLKEAGILRESMEALGRRIENVLLRKVPDG